MPKLALVLLLHSLGAASGVRDADTQLALILEAAQAKEDKPPKGKKAGAGPPRASIEDKPPEGDKAGARPPSASIEDKKEKPPKGDKVELKEGQKVWVRRPEDVEDDDRQDLWLYGTSQLSPSATANTEVAQVMVKVDGGPFPDRKPFDNELYCVDSMVRPADSWRPGQAWKPKPDADAKDFTFTIMVKRGHSLSGVKLKHLGGSLGCKVELIEPTGLIGQYNERAPNEVLQVKEGDIILSVGFDKKPLVGEGMLDSNDLDEFGFPIRIKRIVTQESPPVLPLPRGVAPGIIKMSVFDFDNSISVLHVFKGLIGWPGNELKFDFSRSSYEFAGERWMTKLGTKHMKVWSDPASMELSQMRRIAHFDQGIGRQRGDFATIAFGGEERVRMLYNLLKFLKKVLDVKLIIITRGYVGVVKTCLRDLGMLDFFDDVYGLPANQYGGHVEREGYSKFDKDSAKTPASPDEEALQVTKFKVVQEGKGKKISELMKRHGFKKNEVVFVEDDLKEIDEASKVCLTLPLEEREGMQRLHMDTLRSWSARERGSSGLSPDVEDDLLGKGFSYRALEQAHKEGVTTSEAALTFFRENKDTRTGMTWYAETRITRISADERLPEKEVREAFMALGGDQSGEGLEANVKKHILQKRAEQAAKAKDIPLGTVAKIKDPSNTDWNGHRCVVEGPLGTDGKLLVRVWGNSVHLKVPPEKLAEATGIKDQRVTVTLKGFEGVICELEKFKQFETKDSISVWGWGVRRTDGGQPKRMLFQPESLNFEATTPASEPLPPARPPPVLEPRPLDSTPDDSHMSQELQEVARQMIRKPDNGAGNRPEDNGLAAGTGPAHRSRIVRTPSKTPTQEATAQAQTASKTLEEKEKLDEATAKAEQNMPKLIEAISRPVPEDPKEAKKAADELKNLIIDLGEELANNPDYWKLVVKPKQDELVEKYHSRGTDHHRKFNTLQRRPYA